jgi:hypothetical protein
VPSPPRRAAPPVHGSRTPSADHLPGPPPLRARLRRRAGPDRRRTGIRHRSPRRPRSFAPTSSAPSPPRRITSRPLAGTIGPGHLARARPRRRAALHRQCTGRGYRPPTISPVRPRFERALAAARGRITSRPLAGTVGPGHLARARPRRRGHRSPTAFIRME